MAKFKNRDRGEIRGLGLGGDGQGACRVDWMQDYVIVVMEGGHSDVLVDNALSTNFASLRLYLTFFLILYINGCVKNK